jgi:hypothetical protein
MIPNIIRLQDEMKEVKRRVWVLSVTTVMLLIAVGLLTVNTLLNADTNRKQDDTALLIARHVAALQHGR